MAITYEQVTSWTADMLLQKLAENLRLSVPTMVVDRRVVSDDVADDHLSEYAVATEPSAVIDLTDASHWLALIGPDPERLRNDLQSFGRALTLWCAPLGTAIADWIPDFAKASGNPRIADIVRALYGAETKVVTDSIGDEVLGRWRSALRDLGEGPRAVVDDPWFSHLFLSPSAAKLPLAQPFTLLDLRAPRIPRQAAQQIAAVVFERLIDRAQDRDLTAPEIVCFILDGGDLEPIRRLPTVLSERGDLNSSINIRIVWVNAVESYKEEPTRSSSIPKVVSPKPEDDNALYFMFSSNMDKRHRAAYVKGIMYGYCAFCTFKKPEELPEDLVFLREAGMILGMSSPLVELFDDS